MLKGIVALQTMLVHQKDSVHGSSRINPDENTLCAWATYYTLWLNLNGIGDENIIAVNNF